MFDYQKEKNKSTQYDEQTINNLLGKFIGLGIIADRNSIIRFIKYYNDVLNQMNKLKNTDNIKTNTNDLKWFKQNVPINISTDTWTNVKKAFIYGFGIFNVAVYYPKENLLYDINTNKVLQLSENSITTQNEFTVYLFKERNSLSIVINTELETLVECSLFNFNPFRIYNFDVLNINQTNYQDNHEISLFEKYVQIINNKGKFISNIILNSDNKNISDKKKYKLLADPNNLIPYVIKLWTHDLVPQMFGNFKVKGIKNEQYGGNTNIIYKININKLPKILKKFNISFNEYINKINNLISQGYNIHIEDKYIYLSI